MVSHFFRANTSRDDSLPAHVEVSFHIKEKNTMRRQFFSSLWNFPTEFHTVTVRAVEVRPDLLSAQLPCGTQYSTMAML